MSAVVKPKTNLSKKHIAVKRKVSEGPGLLEESLPVKESGSISNMRKLQKKEHVLPRKREVRCSNLKWFYMEGY